MAKDMMFLKIALTVLFALCLVDMVSGNEVSETLKVTVDAAGGTLDDPVGAGFSNIGKPGTALELTITLGNKLQALNSRIVEPPGGDPAENMPQPWARGEGALEWKTIVGTNDCFWVVFLVGYRGDPGGALSSLKPIYCSVSDVDIDADTDDDAEDEFRPPSRSDEEDRAEFYDRGEEPAGTLGLVGLLLETGGTIDDVLQPGPWSQVVLSLDAKTEGTLTLHWHPQLEMSINRNDVLPLHQYTIKNKANDSNTIPKNGEPKVDTFYVRAKAGAKSPAPDADFCTIRIAFKDATHYKEAHGIAEDIIRVTILDAPYLVIEPAQAVVCIDRDKPSLMVRLKPEAVPDGFTGPVEVLVRESNGSGGEPAASKIQVCNEAGEAQTDGLTLTMDWEGNQQKAFKLDGSSVGLTHVLAEAQFQGEDPGDENPIRESEIPVYVISIDMQLPNRDELSGMRTAADEVTRFVYPSRWEEANRTNLIQYKADAGGAAAPVDLEVRVYDAADNIVWKDKMEWTAEWTDTGFRTRTNNGESVDADGKPNVDTYGVYKFLDPSKDNNRVFKTKLIAASSVSTYTTDEKQFQARSREVFYTREADSWLEAAAKLYMWKIWGVELGEGKERACTDPKKDAESARLYIGKGVLEDAISCLTPRGTFHHFTHGTMTCTLKNIDNIEVPGFAGPASQLGTWNGAGVPYDLTGKFEVHGTLYDLNACYSSAKRGGATCSVIESFKNALDGTAGGDGKIVGYPEKLGIRLVLDIGIDINQTEFSPKLGHPLFTIEEKNELNNCARIVFNNKLNELGLLGIPPGYSNDTLTLGRISSHDNTNIEVLPQQVDPDVLIAAAKVMWRDAFDGREVDTYEYCTVFTFSILLADTSKSPETKDGDKLLID